MPITNEEKAVYTAGAVGVITMLFRFWKTFMQSMRAEKIENAATMSDLSSYTRLQAEVKRLEEIIAQQHLRLARMEDRLNENRKNQLEDVADIAMMQVLMKSFPCGKCDNPIDVFVELRKILAEMVERRERN